MKFLYVFVFLILIMGCSRNEDNPSSETMPNFSKVKEVIYWKKFGTNDSTVLAVRKYTIESGFVTEADFGGDEIVYFEYDEDGRLIQVNGGTGTLDYEIIWNGENCTISTDYSTFNLTYNNENLVELEYIHDEGNVSIYQKRNFEYSGENVIATYLNDTLQSEFLDYHSDVINPLYYLKSIEPWRATINYKPFSKNIFDIRRDQPYSGGDYFSSLKDYEYIYLIKDRYRVESISPEWSIYTWKYEFFD